MRQIVLLHLLRRRLQRVHHFQNGARVFLWPQSLGILAESDYVVTIRRISRISDYILFALCRAVANALELYYIIKMLLSIPPLSRTYGAFLASLSYAFACLPKTRCEASLNVTSIT